MCNLCVFFLSVNKKLLQIKIEQRLRPSCKMENLLLFLFVLREHLGEFSLSCNCFYLRSKYSRVGNKYKKLKLLFQLNSCGRADLSYQLMIVVKKMFVFHVFCYDYQFRIFFLTLRTLNILQNYYFKENYY